MNANQRAASSESQRRARVRNGDRFVDMVVVQRGRLECSVECTRDLVRGAIHCSACRLAC